jgi:hypothetical protein
MEVNFRNCLKILNRLFFMTIVIGIFKKVNFSCSRLSDSEYTTVKKSSSFSTISRDHRTLSVK